MIHGIGSESVALTEYVTFLTSQSVTVNFFQPGLILSKLHPFLRASLDSIVTNVENLESWGVEIKCPHQNRIKVLMIFWKWKSLLRKANGEILLRSSLKFFDCIEGQMFCSQLKKVNFVVYFGRNVPLYVENVVFDENFRQQILRLIEFSSEVLLFLSCSPVEFKYMENCTNTIAEKIKKKGKNGCFISHTHKKTSFAHEYLLNGKLVSINYLSFFTFYVIHMNLN